jgi:acetolactate synthase-1/2/3 large subunit
MCATRSTRRRPASRRSERWKSRAILPRNTITTHDAGASRLLVVQKWEAYGPREFLASNGLGQVSRLIPFRIAA